MLILLIPLLCVILISQYFFPLGNKIAKGINKNSIILLKPNMKEEDIINILGYPLYQENFSGGKRLVYAKQGIFGIGGLGMGLTMENNKMSYMEIKNSWDYGFYMCNKKKCPAYVDTKYYDNLIP